MSPNQTNDHTKDGVNDRDHQQYQDDWKKRLTPEQYKVLRQKATEPPFSGKLITNNDKGSYVCAACGTTLFKSEHKFNSMSGWPSFYDVASEGSVKLTTDNSFGMQRIEASCANCGGHLGHVFNDAPDQPGGKRFCINSVSLDFKPQSE